jgi:hypothetical protein
LEKYIHYGHKFFDRSLFNPIKNQLFGGVKPSGGLWASPINAEFGWKEWCKAEDFQDIKESNSFTFVLTENAKCTTYLQH